jgi:hypothetical protein
MFSAARKMAPTLQLHRSNRVVTVMLRIECVAENGNTRLHLSGELRSAELDGVRGEIQRLSPGLVLDLAEVCAVDVDGVRWLRACETLGIKLENCMPYIREWMLREQP